MKCYRLGQLTVATVESKLWIVQLMVLPSAAQEMFVKGDLASDMVAFLTNHTCSYGKYLASPICGAGVLESKGECMWKTAYMNCK